jgi:cation diffusion facilitator CzcD-associated flavoprotein CzcO
MSRRAPDVAVIGAGPYGLAVAAHLRHAGAPPLVFGEVMEFWRTRMPRAMRLRSLTRASHIAEPDRRLRIDDFAAERNAQLVDPLPLERFVEYAEWYQAHAVPDIDPRRVRTVELADGGFTLGLSDGDRVPVARVVVATGLAPFAYRPPEFAALGSDAASHSSEHVDFGGWHGRRVLVVGGGQSALESAALLNEAGAEVEVLVRRPDVVWLGRHRRRGRLHFPLPPTDVGGRVSGWLAAAPDAFRRLPLPVRAVLADRCIRPAGAAWLVRRLEGVEIATMRRVLGARRRRGEVELRFDDGTTAVAEHVLLATGFSVDVAGYPFLSRAVTSRLRLRGGYPPLGPGLESAVPGLHFVGAPAAMTFGPVMRFVVGTWYAAPAVTRAALGQRQPLLRWSF